MKLAAVSPHAYRSFDIRRLGKNMGDGFILRAIERQLGKIDPDLLVPARKKPSAEQMQRLQSVSHLLLAGANQLNDHFSPWPGLTADDMRKAPFRVVPMGVGISGKPGGGLDLTAEAKDRLRAVHERVEFTSWRCPRTVAAIVKALPEIKSQLLMTSCPVVLDKPLLEGHSFQKSSNVIAATVTDRDDFWDRETAMLRRIADVFPKSERLLVLHQDFSLMPAGMNRNKLSEFVFNPARKLRHFAKGLGYKIKVLRSADEGIELYREQVDLHFGSRLHAHLLMLSLNKWSYLTLVDERMAGFSEFFGFPLADPYKVDSDLDFDFEKVRTQAKIANQTMQKFIASLMAG